MIMNITALRSESFEKYKSDEAYFNYIKEVISDSNSSIQQLVNSLSVANNKIPVLLKIANYLTKDSKSLGTINETMSKINS